MTGRMGLPVVTLGGLGMRIDRELNRMYCTVCHGQVPVPVGESTTESVIAAGRRTLRFIPRDGSAPVVHECIAPEGWKP